MAQLLTIHSSVPQRTPHTLIPIQGQLYINAALMPSVTSHQSEMSAGVYFLSIAHVGHTVLWYYSRFKVDKNPAMMIVIYVPSAGTRELCTLHASAS